MSIALVNIGWHVAAEEIDLVWFSQIYRADFREGGGHTGPMFIGAFDYLLWTQPLLWTAFNP